MATLQEEMAWGRATNLVINGGMAVDQRNAGAAVPNVVDIFVDMWGFAKSGSVIATGQQVVDGPPGLKYSALIDVTTADASIGSTDRAYLYTIIEGRRVSRLGFGAAGASSAALGFGVKANRPGTYSGSIQNGLRNRSFPFPFTVNSAGVWEYKSAVIPGDTSGTWATDNTAGLVINFCMAGGSSFAGTANTWAAQNYVGVTGTINGVAAVTDYMQISEVSLIPGPTPVSQAIAPQLIRPFEEEHELCLRHYQKSFDYLIVPASNTGIDTGEYTLPALVAGNNANRAPRIMFPRLMRAAPTLTFFNPASTGGNARDITAGTNAGAPAAASITESGFRVAVNGSSSTAVGNALSFHWTAEAPM